MSIADKPTKGFVMAGAEKMAKGISKLSKGETPMFPPPQTSRKNKVKKG